MTMIAMETIEAIVRTESLDGVSVSMKSPPVYFGSKGAPCLLSRTRTYQKSARLSADFLAAFQLALEHLQALNSLADWWVSCKEFCDGLALEGTDDEEGVGSRYVAKVFLRYARYVAADF